MRTTYEFTLTPDQYIRSLKRSGDRAVGSMPWGWLVKALWVGIFIIVGFLVALSFDYLGGRYAMIAKPVLLASLALLTILVLYPLVYYRGQRLLMSRPNFMVGTPRVLRIDETGLTSIHAHCSARYDWGGMDSIESAGDLVLLYLDAVFCIPIPASAFADHAERQAFIDFGRARIKARRDAPPDGSPPLGGAELGTAEAVARTEPAPSPSTSSIPPELPPTVPGPSRVSALLANVRNALRLAFFLRVSEERLPVSWWQFAVFACISVAIPPLFALAMSDTGGELQLNMLPGAMLHVGLALFSAIAVGYLLGRAALIPRLLLASVMIAASIDAVIHLSWTAVALVDMRLGSTLMAVYQYGPPLWWALAFAAYAARQGRVTAPRQAAALLALVAIIALPLATLQPDRNLWVPQRAETGERKPRKSPASEEVLNAQPTLLARDLDRIQPGRKGISDLFFVGVAGYGEQDVFRREVDAVDALFRERFDTAGRSIKLINNRGTVLTAPFASKTNLRATLRRVARQMNGDEDVLVLFLTSHGSENHEFSLDLWPLEFNRLNPRVLRELLDESGIRHRVIIVSACYSGGFVNALRDDNTLVISASASDRNSFGCGNEAEWTYFGKAYFDEALRGTYSFTEAFEKALPVISAREKKDDYDPSQPQMASGAGIQARLASIEARLRAQDAIGIQPGR